MKYLNYKICLAFLTILVVSCEDYLDVNKDPNQPTEVPVQLLMSHTTFRTGDNHQLAGNTISYYVQYLAGPNAGGTADTHVPQPYDGTWRAFYRMLADISDMEVLAAEQELAHYEGAAKVLKAINLGLVVDLWGDVPYTEAFFAQYLQPAYDDDEMLYSEVLKLLDDGISLLGTSVDEAQFGGDDFIHGGNVDNWIKMAYSLKARYLLHYSETSQYDPNDVLTAVENGISVNSENADVAYFTDGSTVYNPWSGVARNQEGLILDGWISKQLADAMNGTTFGVVDPRMPFMFGATDGGEFIGVPNGAGRGSGVDVSGERSTIVRNTFYASNDSPLLVITLAETKFIEAEAALDANDPDRAYQAYLDGIAAHMAMIGVADAAAQTYVNDPVVRVGAGSITRDVIMKEKYIAMFLHPEAWSDARRFDYQYTDMTLPANHSPELNGEWVRRLAYPDSEGSRNRENVPNVSTADRLWWDQ
jgi:hypothetical protein